MLFRSPVAAAGKVYMTSLSGKISVLRAGADALEIVAQTDFGERIAATPALAGKMIFIRTATKLYALAEPRVQASL